MAETVCQLKKEENVSQTILIMKSIIAKVFFFFFNANNSTVPASQIWMFVSFRSLP